MRKYKHSPWMLRKASSAEVMCHYLPYVFEHIIVPMEGKMRLLMKNFRLQTEASLYVSDLKFKLSDELSFQMKVQNVVGSGLSDDNVVSLNNVLGALITKYSKKLKQIAE